MARSRQKVDWLLYEGAAEQRVPPAERMAIDDDRWRATVERLDVGEGLRVYLTTADVRRSLSIEPRQIDAGTWLKANISIKGRAVLSFDDGNSARITPERSVLFHSYEGRGRYTLPARQTLRLAGYLLRQDRVKRMFDGDPPKIIRPLIRRPPRVSHVVEVTATARLRQLAASLFTRRFTGPLHFLFLEGVVLQLLAIQAAAGGETQLKEAVPLSGNDRAALEAAREMLLADMSAPQTLGAIAAAVGLGEKQLNAGFKALYGATVFETLRNERLEHARIVLESEDVPIKDVAFRVGYRHVTNFITAFTARYGAPPRQYADGVR